MSVPVRFAHISDSHIKPHSVDRSQRFADVLGEIQAGEYDFVIHTGDMMQEPSAWAARAVETICSPTQVPFYVVPGNHDVYNPPLGEIEAPWWAKLEVTSDLVAQYRNWFGPDWYTTSQQGVHLVGINSLILNSGLPEEVEQWAWLEETLTGLAGRDEPILLFTHRPLFINEPEERLDARDYVNRYVVIEPPGRDRLLGLIRRHRVTAVLSGHIHVPWEKTHTWPEGFSTQFVCTGSSGRMSTLAIDQFDLPSSPEDGLGYHEHRLTENGLKSHYHRYQPPTQGGRWSLGPAWTSRCQDGRMPQAQDGKRWYDAAFRPVTPEWQESAPASCFPLESGEGEALCVRQTFDTVTGSVAMALELLTDRATEIYLNGELLYKLKALDKWPPAWQSVTGEDTIDSPLLHLGLNQRLVRRGQNTLALRLSGRPETGRDAGETISFRSVEPE